MEVTEIGGEVPTNGAAQQIEFLHPYVAQVTVEGVADLLFHRWNCESSAGRIIGVGDYRPTYGRFLVTKFQVRLES